MSILALLHPVLLISPPGGGEIALIVFLALLLFGGRKLPELGASVGKTITNFRKGLAEAEEEDADSDTTTTTSTDTEPTDKR